MAYTTPRTWTTGETVTAAMFNAHLRDNLNAAFPLSGGVAAWTAFTPTLSNGWLLGNATYVAQYMKVGRLVSFYIEITTGSTTTMGTGLDVAIPVTAANGNYTGALAAYCIDTNTTSRYPLMIAATATTSYRLFCVNAAGTYAVGANITATVPFTWATGDIIWTGGTYEAAS